MRVAAGVVAKKLIASAFGGRVVGYVRQVGGIVADIADPAAVTLEQVERLPDGTPNIGPVSRRHGGRPRWWR